jgi:hypothetical protein
MIQRWIGKIGFVPIAYRFLHFPHVHYTLGLPNKYLTK